MKSGSWKWNASNEIEMMVGLRSPDGKLEEEDFKLSRITFSDTGAVLQSLDGVWRVEATARPLSFSEID